jgi:hypothetical protein
MKMNSVAIVTGASQDIGQATALASPVIFQRLSSLREMKVSSRKLRPL